MQYTKDDEEENPVVSISKNRQSFGEYPMQDMVSIGLSMICCVVIMSAPFEYVCNTVDYIANNSEIKVEFYIIL